MLFRADSTRAQCPSVDLQATPPLQGVDISVKAPQQLNFLDPDAARVSKVGNSSTPFALYATGAAPPPSPLSSAPEVRALCPATEYPNVVALDSASVSTSGPTPMSYYAAAAYMATQRCIEFLAQEFKSASSAPWLGFDGTGTLPVEIKLDTSLNTPVKWSLADQRILLDPNSSPYLGASIESMCHELGHGVFRLGLPVSFSLEDFSVEEGFGDALGASAEMYVRGYPGPAAVPLPGGGNLTWSGWCNAGDPSNTTCDRNLQFPILSDSLACHVRDGLGAEIISYCPGDYKGPYFCPFITKCEPQNGIVNGCCDEHGNSTVLSHWFYKVAHGDASERISGVLGSPGWHAAR